MYFSKPWFESSSYIRKFRSIEPKKWFFKEVLPMCSTNEIKRRAMRSAEGACIEELNAFFACLRKWEFDDLRCLKDHDVYMNCVTRYKQRMENLKASANTDEVVSDNGKASFARLNKLFKQWPQHGMGKPPYAKMKRLPNQSYADDIFHRKDTPGKKS